MSRFLRCNHPQGSRSYLIVIPGIGEIHKRHKLQIKTLELLDEHSDDVGNEAFLCPYCRELVYTGDLLTLKTFLEKDYEI